MFTLLSVESQVRIVTFVLSVIVTFTVSDMTTSITETPEVGVQLPEWRVTLYRARQNMLQVWGNGCIRYLLSHPTLAEPQGFTSS